MNATKKDVQKFWEADACGERLYLAGTDRGVYERQAAAHYALEPDISEFVNFVNSRAKRVLEIGTGLGADHQRFAETGAVVVGDDLTAHAVLHVRQWFAAFGIQSSLLQADAEALPFVDDTPAAWRVHRDDQPSGNGRRRALLWTPSRRGEVSS